MEKLIHLVMMDYGMRDTTVLSAWDTIEQAEEELARVRHQEEKAASEFSFLSERIFWINSICVNKRDNEE